MIQIVEDKPLSIVDSARELTDRLVALNNLVATGGWKPNAVAFELKELSIAMIDLLKMIEG